MAARVTAPKDLTGELERGKVPTTAIEKLPNQKARELQLAGFRFPDLGK